MNIALSHWVGKHTQAFRHLTWEQQIDLVCRNVSRKLTLMKLLSKYVNQNSLKQYYNSYVLPVFDFGCVVWGNTTNTTLTRRVKLRKWAVRGCPGWSESSLGAQSFCWFCHEAAHFMTPSEQLFLKRSKLATILKTCPVSYCLTVYKNISGQAPEYISSLLTYVSDHHERQIRATTLY